MRRSSLALALALALNSYSQVTIKYTGNTLSNIDYHHGQLNPVVGVHNIQVFRANRENSDSAGRIDWTYHHGPNIAYWNNTFFVQFLSNPVGEHIPPGQVFLVTSKNGYKWSKPQIIFPNYRIPDGTTKEGVEGVAKDLDAVLHQRMGFYVANNGKLLTLAYYGICLNNEDSPNDGKGIGRVVREINVDGSFGLIYFIRYNSAWTENNTSYPFYKSSKDKKFIEACDELLADPLMMQQWVEEADRDDPLIPLKKQFKAFSYYHLNDGSVVGLWKHALSSISSNNGQTWPHPERSPGFVNRNAKIWGQKTSDGNYATVYNPSRFRWPLAISTSKDGIEYTNLLLVNGEITTMRYGGQHKSYGPQYVRGILEGNGTPPNGNMWVTYSMNKEDIWVSKIPIPVIGNVENHVNDIFNNLPDGEELNNWNIYSPLMASVKIIKKNDGIKWLKLSDWDKFDYAIAERVIPSSKKLEAEFLIIAEQNDHGILHIEFQNSKGNACVRLIFDEEGNFKNKDGYSYNRNIRFDLNREYKVKVKLDVEKNYYEVYVDDKKVTSRQFFAPVESINRIVFRTGERRYYPNPDSPGKQDFNVPNGGEFDKPATFYIKYLRTSNF
ncbi:six-hairpin glycosidase [Bacteroidota bacterium]